MSDAGGGWQSPGSSDAQEPPRFGQFAPPSSNGASPQQPDGAPQTGWTPPPKPGLVPLRPLGFGTLLGAPFRVLRHSRALIGLALVLQIGVFVIGGGLLVAVAIGGIGRVTDFEDPEQQPLIAGGVAGLIISALVLAILSLTVSAVLQGFVVGDVARGVLGQRTRLAELWRIVRGRIVPLALWTLVVFVAMAVEIAIVAGIAALGAIGAPTGLAISIPIAIVVALGFVVLTVWITVKLSLLPSALVLERLRLGAALRRSWTLTDGNFWRTFGLQALLTVMISIASQIIATPVSLLPLAGVPFGSISTGPALALSVVSSILSIVVSIIVGAISSIVISAAIALLYLDLRMRKEGLDLVLQRYVEDPDPATDPFAPGAV